MPTQRYEVAYRTVRSPFYRAVRFIFVVGCVLVIGIVIGQAMGVGPRFAPERPPTMAGPLRDAYEAVFGPIPTPTPAAVVGSASGSDGSPQAVTASAATPLPTATAPPVVVAPTSGPTGTPEPAATPTPSCTFAIAGTSTTVTITGLDAPGECQQWYAGTLPNGWRAMPAQPAGRVLCSATRPAFRGSIYIEVSDAYSASGVDSYLCQHLTGQQIATS